MIEFYTLTIAQFKFLLADKYPCLSVFFYLLFFGGQRKVTKESPLQIKNIGETAGKNN